MTVKPTLTSNGYDLYTCTLCNDSYQDNFVDALTYLPSDINGDEIVDNADIDALLKHLTGWDVYVVELALDVNNDGQVNIRDAATILLFLEGKISELN